tara:strand:- start:26201 stop:26560 length:360 start_codon:yes stop_codon:yes gene_type:complete
MKSRISTINEKIRKAIKKIEREEKVTIKLGHSKYGRCGTFYNVPMTITQTSAKRSNDVTNSKSLGFTKNVMGKSFLFRGENFKISDLKMRSPKFPVIGKNEKGVEYKFTVDLVKKSLVN